MRLWIVTCILHFARAVHLQFHRYLNDTELLTTLANASKTLEWQSQKARDSPEWVRGVDRSVENGIYNMFRRQGIDMRGKNVLCIGARAGGEVRAFRRLGAFAVGIDLFPIEFQHGALVLRGTALDLQFATGCIDRVFTNILDHIPDLPRFATEVARVLKPDGGLFLADVLLQIRISDEWAVRNTGTDEFYHELADSFGRTKVMQHCRTMHDSKRANWLRKLRKSDRRFINKGASGQDFTVWVKGVRCP